MYSHHLVNCPITSHSSCQSSKVCALMTNLQIPIPKTRRYSNQGKNDQNFPFCLAPGIIPLRYCVSFTFTMFWTLLIPSWHIWGHIKTTQLPDMSENNMEEKKNSDFIGTERSDVTLTGFYGTEASLVSSVIWYYQRHLLGNKMFLETCGIAATTKISPSTPVSVTKVFFNIINYFFLIASLNVLIFGINLNSPLVSI